MTQSYLVTQRDPVPFSLQEIFAQFKNCHTALDRRFWYQSVPFFQFLSVRSQAIKAYKILTSLSTCLSLTRVNYFWPESPRQSCPLMALLSYSTCPAAGVCSISSRCGARDLSKWWNRNSSTSSGELTMTIWKCLFDQCHLRYVIKADPDLPMTLILVVVGLNCFSCFLFFALENKWQSS